MLEQRLKNLSDISNRGTKQTIRHSRPRHAVVGWMWRVVKKNNATTLTRFMLATKGNTMNAFEERISINMHCSPHFFADHYYNSRLFD